MQPQPIVILGGGGFIGANLARMELGLIFNAIADVMPSDLPDLDLIYRPLPGTMWLLTGTGMPNGAPAQGAPSKQDNRWGIPRPGNRLNYSQVLSQESW